MGAGCATGVGICGLGTVGGGALALLERNAGEIARRLGRPLEVVHVATRTPKPDRTRGVPRAGRDPFAVAADPAVDVLVETMGGLDPAFELIAAALAGGKHVVTANKALLAERGDELFAVARDHGACLAFEAAVAGGVPVVKALREGLAANRVEWLAGILNGTANFILSEMAARGRDFDGALADARRLGYAEADPRLDVDGTDAAHKLAILAALAFGVPLGMDRIHVEGIDRIAPEDIAYAAELGYAVKHLGIARRAGRGVELRAHPALVPRPLADVHGADNAVLIRGDAAGATLYRGPGAGAEATASAVVADLMDIARLTAAGARPPLLPDPGPGAADGGPPALPMEEIETEYYLRVPVMDRVGALAGVTGVLTGCGISIEAVIQKEPAGGPVPVVILSRRAAERDMDRAVAAIEGLDAAAGPVAKIRVESLRGGAE